MGRIAGITALTLLTGCASVTHIGTVGGVDFYAVNDPNLIAPSTSTVVSTSMR